MVDEIRKITAQQFSQTGMKLSDIKHSNELLFNYFKNAGYKEDAMIYSSDVENLTKKFDANNDGKLSLKELKTMLGEDVSRSERRAARKALNTITTNDLSSTEELMPETVDEHTTNYRNNKGEIVYTEATDEAGSTKTYPFNGSDIKLAKKERFENSLPDMVTTTEYLDGEPTMPSKETVNDNGDITTTEYKYDGTRLHTSEETHGNDIIFKKYRTGTDGFPEPTLTMEYKKGTPEQFRSFENQFDTEGHRTGIVIENTGSYIKDNGGVLKEEITLAPEGYEISSEQVKGIPDKFIKSKTVTIQKEDNTQEIQYFKNFDGKLHRIEKTEDGTEFLTIKIPQGWSIEKLAEQFGVKVEDLLNANKDKKGNPTYLTNSSGKHYFNADQNVRIINPAKISEELPEDRYAYGEDISSPLPKPQHTTTTNNAAVKKNTRSNSTPANNTKIKKTVPKRNKKKYPVNKLNYGEVRMAVSAPAMAKSPDPRILLKRSRLKIGTGEKPLIGANAYNSLALYHNMSRSGQTIASASLHFCKWEKPEAITELKNNLKYLKQEIDYANNNRFITNVPHELYAYVPRPGASDEQIAKEARVYEEIFGPGSSGIELS